MTLRYIAIGLDYDYYIEKNNKLRYGFQLHTRYISNYFSRKIRIYKFDTAGVYNMISISLLPEGNMKQSKIKANDVLQVFLPFDEKKYEKIKGTEDCGYYLELLEQGFRKASVFKSIPLDALLDLIDDFRKGGCKNEWLHKKKKFKDQNLEIILTCEFTTNHFQLVATINQISTKQELIKEVIIKTEPDEVLFGKMFKDVLIENNEIIVTDSSNSPRVIIDIEDLYSSKFKYQIIGDKEIQKILSYKL
ncbi:hypothetical protein CEQ15_14140 [Chryseobacterium indologenes]|uniref:hypothetical protein n=1 Tax=Chryseobacterium indologenes TaxID=253 RepID=UPI000B51BE8B|nr:hypothetical protein [Chryseobacterium indologenes]ASE62553.1 hypothetical protein CEQ15_14140 [Chryseobacterium indologenes]